jgi:Ni,Fe-hydrogenase III large subunit
MLASFRWLSLVLPAAVRAAAAPAGAFAAPRRRALTVSVEEGWRGEIVHAAVWEKGRGIATYKAVDPSFHNWPGLSFAVRGNVISDFPLCNKSFNLSYSGADL